MVESMSHDYSLLMFERPSRRWLFMAAVTLLAVLPILLALVVLFMGDRWYPAGDMAQAELHMRGFFTHPPLVGAAGRIVSDAGFQGSHPGPGLWVAMLPVYIIGGQSSAALLAAAASVHIAAIFLAVLLACRRGGAMLGLMVGVGALLIVRASGTDFMVEPWNPWLAILPFMVFIFLIGEVIDARALGPRQGRALIGAVVVGSYCVQCHAGYAVLVVGALAISTLMWWWQERQDSSTQRLEKRSERRTILWKTMGGLAVAALMWLPVLIDQRRRVPGNLTILWQHFVTPSEPTISLGEALRVISTQMNILGPWLTGPGGDAPSESWGRYLGCLLLVALWGWATLVVREPAQKALFRWQIMMAGFMGLGALSISRIFGPYYEYTVRWFWVLSCLTAITSLYVLIRHDQKIAFLTSKISRRKSFGVLVVAALVLLSIASGLQARDRVKLPGRTESRVLAELIPQVVPKLDVDKKYLLRMYDPYTLNATGFGSVLELERRGIDVGVELFQSAPALPHRVRYEDEVDEILWVVVGPAISKADQDTALTKLGYANPRSESEEVLAQELLTKIASMLDEAGREELISTLDTPGASLIFAEPPLPNDIATAVRRLISLGQPVAIYEVAPGTRVRSLE